MRRPPTPRRRLPRHLAFAVVALPLVPLAGCDDDGTTPVAASASAAPAPPSAKEACARVCERATRCGLEQAEAIAAKGGPDDARLVAAAKEASVVTEARCVDACAPSAEAGAGAAERLTSCLDQARCDTFAACIERVGSEPG